MVQDVPIGSMLIQSEAKSGEPLLYSLALPPLLKASKTAADATVLLLDSQIGTGAAALMAIRVLLDHGVLEENIIVLVFLVSKKGGLSSICSAFP